VSGNEFAVYCAADQSSQRRKTLIFTRDVSEGCDENGLAAALLVGHVSI
jgi:hypothetical protein